MPIIQISKIQLRRGPSSDLPSPTLDNGELGFTTDLGRLFIGQDTPTNGQANFDRAVFPFHNVEVLTENSPLEMILAPVINDNRHAFLRPAVMELTNTPVTVQLPDGSNVLQDFHLEFPGSGANATIFYYMFDDTNKAIRLGRFTVLWNANLDVVPVYFDDAEVVLGSTTTFTWSAELVGSHLVWRYINQTAGRVHVLFRIDRPIP